MNRMQAENEVTALMATGMHLRTLVLPVVAVQQAEVVVDFGACVVLLEEPPVLRQGVVEIADALIVDGETEVIGRRRRRRD